MVKKHVISIMKMVYEDGETLVTGTEKEWIHKDENTWTDYDTTDLALIQAIRDAGFGPYDRLGDRIDKQHRDENKRRENAEADPIS